MIGAAAFDARAKPAKGRAWSGRVGLPLDFPESVGSQELPVQFVPRLAPDAGSAVGQRIGPHMLLVIFSGVQQGPRFEHHNIQPTLRKHLGGGAASGAGAYDAYVVNLWRGSHLRHSES